MRRRPILVSLAIVALLVALAAMALGAEPSPSPVAPVVLEGGDLRSDGAGPGLVGNPLLILGAVVALGLVVAAVTVVIARLLQRE